MKHFLKKKDLCIKGFTLTQFPNVIAPLSLGKMNNLTSFTFAEIIDLLSDGPIEGLVNKFGDKLSDENLLEGVYFNEVPVKESSSTNKLSVPIDFLTKALKDFWNCNDTQDPKIINGDFIQKIIEPREIDDPNFTVNTLQKIQITSYHPSASIRAYINEIGGDLKNAPLIEKIFDLSPTISERPFFTKIFIPDFDIFLPDYIFYDEENADFPLKAEIINLSDFIYFSITSDNFNSFNYFELPRSYARNNAVSKTGKKTIYFTKITDSNTPAGFSKCRISNLNLYIWSIYSLEYGIKKIKDILESSFKYIYIYKNNSSLYNFSFTDVELKNGSEFQSPLKYFSEVNIDTDYNKELLGPYKLTNSANLSNLSTSASNQVLDVDVENIIINVLGNRPTANSSNILIKAAEYTKQVEYDSKAKKITDVLSNLPLTLTNAELESKITTILGKRPVTPAEFTNAASQQGGGLFQNFIPKISAQLANTTSSWDAKAALLRNSIVRRIPHSSSAELGPGGVQRVISFQDGGLGTVNLDILTETSDDIRYISIWPQEYGASGSVWAICDAQPNYAAIDKNAIERKSQDAIPVTHYINNPNVEKAFITLNIQQLSDTNHIDLVDDSVTDLDNTKDKMTKQENTSSPPDGTPTYGELPGVTNIPAGQVSSRYFLVLQSKTDATLKYVIDSSTSLDLIFKNLKDLLTLPIVLTSSAATIQGTTELISLTYSTEGLGKIIPSISSIIVPTKDSIKATYNATSTNKLQNYIVPTKYNIFPTPSFNLQNYIDTATNISKNLYGVTNSLDSLLKTKNPSNNSLLLYNFGLRDKEYIYSLSTTPTEVKLPDINTGTEFSLKVYEYQIIQKQSTFTYASVAAVSISKFIAYNNYFNLLSGSDTFAEKDNTLIAKNYPYIYKYIVVKLRNQIIYLLDKIKSTSSTIQTNTKKTFIDSLSDPLKSIFNIFLIGINYEYLVAQTNFWTGTVGSSYLTQDALEALLRDYALLSGDSYPYFLSYQKFSDPIITDKLRNILNTFDQKILLNKTIFDFGITYPVNTISKSTNIYRSDFIKNNTFDTSLIYLKNSSYNLANNTYDAIIDYSMFSDQESELLTQSVNRTPHWVFSDRTKQDANPSDTWTSATQLKCVVQTLAAGTLMPAVVSIKVDTGYESSLDGNQQIYSSCRYDIFGLSNGPALIDLGSTNFSNIKTTELISPRFSITDCASYSYNQNQYLSLITLKYKLNNVITTGNYILPTRNLGTDLNRNLIVYDNYKTLPFFIDKINFSNGIAVDQNYCDNYLSSFSNLIQSGQYVCGISASKYFSGAYSNNSTSGNILSEDIPKIYSQITGNIFNKLKKELYTSEQDLSKFNINQNISTTTSKDLDLYFDKDSNAIYYTKLNLINATPYLKKYNYLPSQFSASTTYSNSFAVDNINNICTDIYCIYPNSQSLLSNSSSIEIQINNFIFNTFSVSNSFSSSNIQDAYTKFYIRIFSFFKSSVVLSSNNSSLQEDNDYRFSNPSKTPLFLILQTLYPSDLFYEYNGLLIKVSTTENSLVDKYLLNPSSFISYLQALNIPSINDIAISETNDTLKSRVFALIKSDLTYGNSTTLDQPLSDQIIKKWPQAAERIINLFNTFGRLNQNILNNYISFKHVVTGQPIIYSNLFFTEEFLVNNLSQFNYSSLITSNKLNNKITTDVKAWVILRQNQSSNYFIDLIYNYSNSLNELNYQPLSNPEIEILNLTNLYSGYGDFKSFNATSDLLSKLPPEPPINQNQFYDFKNKNFINPDGTRSSTPKAWINSCICLYGKSANMFLLNPDQTNLTNGFKYTMNPSENDIGKVAYGFNGKISSTSLNGTVCSVEGILSTKNSPITWSYAQYSPKNTLSSLPLSIKGSTVNTYYNNVVNNTSSQFKLTTFEKTKTTLFNQIDENSKSLTNELKFHIVCSIQDSLQGNGDLPVDVLAKNPLSASINYTCLCVSGGYQHVYFVNFSASNEVNSIDVVDNSSNFKIPPAILDENGNSIKRFIKVTKMSHETLSPLIQKNISLQKVTEIIPQVFSYPFTSLVGIKIDSRAFASIPDRSFECKLKKVLVPSNIFYINEYGNDVRYIQGLGKYQIYKGDWDGTFKLAWTNNPAWILMDLIINKRYGLGAYIEADQVDIWELYKISRWCDGVDENGYYYGVPDTYGGVEPRFTFNALINDAFNVFDMLNQIASTFMGHVFYLNSLVTFDDDRIKPVIGEFNNSDVKDGLFNYTNMKKDDEYTAVDVAYMDERDFYRPKMEYVENSEGIRLKGLLKKQINAYGVTSRGQARRFGKHFLYKTSKENLNISFVTDSRALIYKPGDLININDELLLQNRNFGSVKSINEIYINNRKADFFEITIDRILDPNLYSLREITLYVPINKPKYEDILASKEAIPKKTTMNYLGLTKFMNISAGIGVDLPNFQLNTYKNNDYSIYLSGSFQGTLKNNIYTTPTIFKTVEIPIAGNVSLKHIDSYDMNGYQSKNGHWVMTTGDQNYFAFDLLNNAATKARLTEKKYFFEYFDTGAFYKVTGYQKIISDIDPQTLVETYEVFPLYERKNFGKEIIDLFKFDIVEYESPKIAYKDILEFDRPSIDTFAILQNTIKTGSYLENNEIYNEYTTMCVSKFEINNYCEQSIGSNVVKKYKTSISDEEGGILNIPVHSAYSLKMNQNESTVFKIQQICETYINEYSIFAIQYNEDKYKEIEEYRVIDNEKDSFNFLYGSNYRSASFESISKGEKKINQLNAVVIKSFEFVKYQNSLNFEVKWYPIIINSDYNVKYELYLETPSKQTPNLTIIIDKTNIDNFYNKDLKYFTFSQAVTNAELGSYKISIKVSYDELNVFANSPTSYKTTELFEY